MGVGMSSFSISFLLVLWTLITAILFLSLPFFPSFPLRRFGVGLPLLLESVSQLVALSTFFLFSFALRWYGDADGTEGSGRRHLRIKVAACKLHRNTKGCGVVAKVICQPDSRICTGKVLHAPPPGETTKIVYIYPPPPPPLQKRDNVQPIVPSCSREIPSQKKTPLPTHSVPPSQLTRETESSESSSPYPVPQADARGSSGPNTASSTTHPGASA